MISSNGQLASLIAHHDGAGSGVFSPQVTVTCTKATPRGSRAGDFDHRCREEFMGALCISGSTPEVEVLYIDVLSRGYRNMGYRVVDPGDCSMP